MNAELLKKNDNHKGINVTHDGRSVDFNTASIIPKVESPEEQKKKKMRYIIAGILLTIVLVLAIVLPIVLVDDKPSPKPPNPPPSPPPPLENYNPYVVSPNDI